MNGYLPAHRRLPPSDRHPHAAAKDTGKQKRDRTFLQDTVNLFGSFLDQVFRHDHRTSLGKPLFQPDALHLHRHHRLYYLCHEIQKTISTGKSIVS